MADDIQPDQETYDRLIAAGESERTARANRESGCAPLGPSPVSERARSHDRSGRRSYPRRTP